MDDQWSETRRGLLLFGGVVLVILILVPVMLIWNTSNPGTSNEAKRREQLLRHVEVGDFVANGFVLLSETSSAGEAASGFAADNPDDVKVVRRYSFEVDSLAACETATTLLSEKGWTGEQYRYPCEILGPGQAMATMSRSCQSFTIYADIRTFGGDEKEPDRVLEATVRTPYASDAVDPNAGEPPSGHRGTSTSTTTLPRNC